MNPPMSPIGISVAALAIVGISLHIFFMRRLQLLCPDEWERLGSPNPFFSFCRTMLRTGWASHEIRDERSIRDTSRTSDSCGSAESFAYSSGCGCAVGGFTSVSYCSLRSLRGFTGFSTPSNQSMKPTAPFRNEFSVFCHDTLPWLISFSLDRDLGSAKRNRWLARCFCCLAFPLCYPPQLSYPRHVESCADHGRLRTRFGHSG